MGFFIKKKFYGPLGTKAYLSRPAIVTIIGIIVALWFHFTKQEGGKMATDGHHSMATLHSKQDRWLIIKILLFT